MKAGRMSDDYSRNVSSFDWDGLYKRSRWLFHALAEQWSGAYQYVLIDSRTGMTDTSGICTTLMPEKLVIVFTPNRQSFTGIANLIEKATSHRTGSDDVRPLAVFPLPSRIESQMEQLKKVWRYGNRERGIKGYQPLFTELFQKIYQLDEKECDLEDYFSEVQIQQSPDFAYGEEAAVNLDEQRDRFSLARSYQTFTEKLVMLDLPWEQVEEEAAALDRDAGQIVELAENAFRNLAAREHGRRQTAGG
jgi:hypothetical protein